MAPGLNTDTGGGKAMKDLMNQVSPNALPVQRALLQSSGAMRVRGSSLHRPKATALCVDVAQLRKLQLDVSHQHDVVTGQCSHHVHASVRASHPSLRRQLYGAGCGTSNDNSAGQASMTNWIITSWSSPRRRRPWRDLTMTAEMWRSWSAPARHPVGIFNV